MSKLLPNVILGVVGVGLLAALVGGDGSPSFQVRRWGALTADDGFAFDVINVDHRTITIAAAKINERSDCSATAISLVGARTFPLRLKVGDQVTFVTSCRVIRIELETDAGSAEFSF